MQYKMNIMVSGFHGQFLSRYLYALQCVCCPSSCQVVDWLVYDLHLVLEVHFDAEVYAAVDKFTTHDFRYAINTEISLLSITLTNSDILL